MFKEFIKNNAGDAHQIGDVFAHDKKTWVVITREGMSVRVEWPDTEKVGFDYDPTVNSIIDAPSEFEPLGRIHRFFPHLGLPAEATFEPLAVANLRQLGDNYLGDRGEGGKEYDECYFIRLGGMMWGWDAEAKCFWVGQKEHTPAALCADNQRHVRDLLIMMACSQGRRRNA